jgi:aminoglycoside/choline kinase family phosphotransferase
MQLAADAQVSAGELPFLNVGRHLAARGVRIPRLYATALHEGLVLLEDLGDETFEVRLHREGPPAWDTLYGAAIDTLADLHVACARPDPECVAYGRCFDRPLLRWELDHFREWGLEALGFSLSAPLRTTLDAEFEGLVDRLLALPQAFTHRDYQSRNLMWWGGELCVLDFQDALIGPFSYDLVALLCDSYVPLDEARQRRMLARYATRRGFDDATTDALVQGFWLCAVQRKLKDAGRFVFLDRVRHNPAFLRFFAPSMGLVARALGHAHLTGLTDVLRSALPGFPEQIAEPSPVST